MNSQTMNNTTQEQTQCSICDNTEQNTLYDVREMMLGIRDMHTYFECAQCGCLQIANVPENIQEYYPSDDYYSYDEVKTQGGIKGALIKMRDRYAATGSCLVGRVMQYFQPHDKLPSLRHAGITLDSKIMDVGCGAGHLMYSMKDAGFKNLLGIDPYNKEPINYANGLDIQVGSIHDMPLVNPQGDWDLIMFNHSFEHVADQHEVLAKVMQLLKSGGVCMIRVPTVTSWAWRSYGTDWVQLDAPRHLFLHSLQSMNTLAVKHGFMLENVAYDSFAFQEWGSEQYKKDIPLSADNSYSVNPEKSPFSEAQISEYDAHAKELNASKAGDQAAFYLRKPS